jgi:hypothetical protein
VTSTPQQFAVKLDDLASTFDPAQLRIITERVARALKAPMTAAIHPNTLSGFGRGSRRGSYTVKARYDMDGDHALMAPTVKPLAAILEDGARNPWDNPKRSSGRRKTVGYYYRAPVPARHAWRPAVAVARRDTGRLVDLEVQKVLRRLFSG